MICLIAYKKELKILEGGVSFDNQYKKNLYMINQKCCFKEGDTEFDGVIVGVSSVGELCVKIQNDYKYFKYKQDKIFVLKIFNVVDKRI